MVKQKVMLVFCSNVEVPMLKDHFSKEIEIEVPSEIGEEVHLVAACVSEQESTKKEECPSTDSYASIWNDRDESRLVGNLLTYIDATYADKEQREAHKDIVKKMAYGFYNDIYNRCIQTIRSQITK